MRSDATRQKGPQLANDKGRQAAPSPLDVLEKALEMLRVRGFRFLHILSPCPTGWKSEPSEGIGLVRKAVRSGLYPIYEISDGNRLVINVESELSEEALQSYFAAQGRFRKTKIDFVTLRTEIVEYWNRLKARQSAARARARIDREKPDTL